MFDEIILMKLIDAYYCSEAGLFTRPPLSGCSWRIWLNSLIHFTPENSQNQNVWEHGETWKRVVIWFSTFTVFHAFHLYYVSLIFDIYSYHRSRQNGRKVELILALSLIILQYISLKFCVKKMNILDEWKVFGFEYLYMFWPGPHRNGPNIKKLFEPFDLAIELAGHCCLKSNASHPAEPIVPKSYSWEWQQCLMMAGEGRGLAGFQIYLSPPPSLLPSCV